MNNPRPSSPSPFQRRVCWLSLSGLAILTLISLAVLFVYVIGRLFLVLEPVLLPVIIAGILAYLLFPVVKHVQHGVTCRGIRIWCGVKKRSIAVLLVLILGLGSIASFGAFVIPPLVKETKELFTNREQIKEYATETGREFLKDRTEIQWLIDKLHDKTVQDARKSGMSEKEMQELQAPSNHEQKLISVITFNSLYLLEKGFEWLTAGTRAIYGATGFLIGVIMVPIFLFYFLILSDDIIEKWHTIIPLRDSRFRQEVVETLQQINDNIIAFVRGQVFVSIIDGVILFIALYLLGIKYAIAIAVAAAVLGIIPYIGMISTSIPAMLIAGFIFKDVEHVVAVAMIFFGVSQLDGWFIQPKLVGNRVGMHDLTIIFSVLFWSLVLGGVVGALLAVPLTAAIKVLFMRYVWPTLGKNKPADSADEPAGTPPEALPPPAAEKAV